MLSLIFAVGTGLMQLLPSSLVAAGASPVAVPADGTYNYTYQSTMTQAQSSGKSSISVQHSGSAVKVTENSSGTIMGTPATGVTTQTLGPDLSPTGYMGSYTGGGRTLQSSVTFTGNVANATTPEGPRSFAMTPGATHFVILDGGMLGGFFILPAQMNAWQRASVDLIAPIYGQSAPLTLDTSTTPPTRPTAVPANDISISFSVPVAFTEWYDPITLIMDEFDVPSQGITVTRVR
jgi:hypothetical protein